MLSFVIQEMHTNLSHVSEFETLFHKNVFAGICQIKIGNFFEVFLALLLEDTLGKRTLFKVILILCKYYNIT